MITEEQKERLMEMIDSYGVNQSLRGFFIAQGKELSYKEQERFAQQKLEQIETYLANMVGIERRDRAF